MTYIKALTLCTLLAHIPLYASSGVLDVVEPTSSKPTRSMPAVLSTLPETMQALHTIKSMCKPEERLQFTASSKWYSPTAANVHTVLSHDFSPSHLGAALRFCASITTENAPFLKAVLKGATWQMSLDLLPASLGLSHEVLQGAAGIEDLSARLTFLKQSPRPDTWVLGMLGSDPLIDSAVLEHHVRERILMNPIGMSAFFVKSLKHGDTLTRMRLTSFLLHTDPLSVGAHLSDKKARFEKIGFRQNSRLARTLDAKKVLPPFGFLLDRSPDGNVTRITTRYPDFWAPLPAWTHSPSQHRPVE
ncbi:MAG: hypothetical protein C0514_02305 [Candidatus Puniceispirillum sp.]|nr:hypothetical protein [Candidatus Puniceispirillum sp.]